MKPLEAGNLRSNLGTWAVRDDQLPAVARAMLESLPPEPFDLAFRGQHLETTYFDTASFDLRKARVKGGKYLTVRLRCYRQDGEEEDQDEYALSAKTEDVKVRIPVDPKTAHFLLAGEAIDQALLGLLPPAMGARLVELTGDEPVLPVVCVCARRYATENADDRLTLDTGIRSSRGECYPFNVLEFKSTNPEDPPPGPVLLLGLNPIKASKFLWSTREV